MTTAIFTAIILPDKQEAWRRCAQELAGSRGLVLVALADRLQLQHIQAWLQPAPGYDLAVVLCESCLPPAGLRAAVARLAEERWLCRRLLDLHGINLVGLLQKPAELVFDWKGDIIAPVTSSILLEH